MSLSSFSPVSMLEISDTISQECTVNEVSSNDNNNDNNNINNDNDNNNNYNHFMSEWI